ncbi:MAG TPA: geranylgeranylglycerol-phosphate geranylgeranyltransferase [Bacteroidales bacterium]|jgi:4-hydroxybenzoate polyprenyltransferase|nr:geranylgeranylglycerol-phosphate geranylgeranyltransferase [Bacteroidales bacterium]
MKSFLNLIRWPNLVIVTLTMILMRYAVIEPVVSKINVFLVSSPGSAVPISLQLPWYDFTVLVLATVLITAGGYVINDYFDIKTDLINKGEVIVGTKIPRRKAMMWHNTLNVAGVVAGFYISWRVGYFWMGLLFLVVSGLLYFYSASYKRQFLVGNFVVALLTGMVPMLVAIYEWPSMYRFYAVYASPPPDLSIIFYWIGGFAIFAFLTTLTREIIKDIEDFEGDQAYGRNTVPVVTGIFTAKMIAVLLIAVTIGLLYAVWYFFLNDKITLAYLSVAVVVPLFYVVCKVIRSSGRKQLHAASRMMKIVMMAGVLYSVVVKLILDQNLV